MHIQELLFLIILNIFRVSASVVISPPGTHYVKSNIQLVCTDDDADAIQPQWISPSGEIVAEYKPHRVSCPSSQYCDDDIQRYCYNAFATCINNRCVCQKFGIDPCTCLVSIDDCRMVRENLQNVAVARLESDTLPSYITCESNTAAQTEVHIIAMKYGIASPDSTNVNVKILNRINAEKEVVLVLVSDRLVFWKVNVESNGRLRRLVQLSRFQDEDNLKVSSGYIDGIDKPKNAPFGIGDDEQYGGKTVDMLLYLQEKYGHVSSFTGTYTANEWNITIDLSKNNQANAEHKTSILTEREMPWRTKLTITRPKNEDFGKYTCRGRSSQSDVILFKRDPILIEAPSLQNLTFGENGIVKCLVSGRPQPVVTWRFNGTTINESEKYIMETDGSLRINKADENDGGEYNCIGSQRETDESRIKPIQVLIIHKLPNAPVIWFFKKDINSHSALIYINSSNSLNELSEFYYLLSFNERQLKISRSAYQKINITSLTPSTEYCVHAFAVSKGGKSNISNFINFTTNKEDDVRKALSKDIGLTTLEPFTEYITQVFDGSNEANSNISEFMNLTSEENTTKGTYKFNNVTSNATSLETPSEGIYAIPVFKEGNNSSFGNFTSNKEDNSTRKAVQTDDVIYCTKRRCRVLNKGSEFKDVLLVCIGISRCYKKKLINKTYVWRQPSRFNNAINSSKKLGLKRCRRWWNKHIVLVVSNINKFLLKRSEDNDLQFGEINEALLTKYILRYN